MILKKIGWNIPTVKSEFFDENQLQICAVENKKLIGFISGFIRRLDSEGNVAYISFVCVLPEYQGLGIGRELIRRFKNEYKDNVLYFLVSSYDQADVFYEKCGFSYDTQTKSMIAQI